MTRPWRVEADPAETVDSFWRKRLHQHFVDTYRGRGLVKFPEDLRTYQHIIEESRPEVIVELGTWDGGSAMWFADQLRALCGGGRVITVDIDIPSARITDDAVTFLRGDAISRYGDIRELIDGAKRVMVVDDASHDYQATLDALRTYSQLVAAGQYHIVEDTIIDTPMSIWPSKHGAGEAVKTFLTEQDRFVPEPLDLYGLTMHMGGWLKAVR